MSPSNFSPGLRRACTAWRRRHPARKQEGGGGGVTEFARGQQRGGPPAPGRRAFKPRVGSIVPCLAMISSIPRSGRWGRGCHVPGSAPCAARGDPPGRSRGHRGSQRRAEGKGWRPERGSGMPNNGRGGIAPQRPRFSGDCPPAHPHLPSPKGGRPECRAGFGTPRMGCGLWPVGWSSRALLGGPDPAKPGSRPAPRRVVRAPGGVAVAVQPLP